VAMSAAPAGAHASLIGSPPPPSDIIFGYRADSGETNDVTVAYTPGGPTGTYTVTDTGVLSIGYSPFGSGGCVANVNQATCAGIPVSFCIPLDVGDLNDRISLDSNVPCSRLFDGDGDDVMVGGDGNDTLDNCCWGGDDQFSGGGGDDETLGWFGDDILLGGGGADSLEGGPDNDTVRGGDGADSLNGDLFNVPGFPDCGCTLNDKIWGDGGDDSVQGGPGDDVVHGGEGDDRLDAGEAGVYAGVAIGQYDGADQLDGGAGSDVLFGRPADADDDTSDNLFCGDGPDDYAYAGASDVVSTTCEGWTQFVLCPQSATGFCEGSVTVVGSVAGGSAAGAHGGAAAAGKRRRRVVLGRGMLERTRPGQAREVRFILKRRKVRRVLRGRSKAPARTITRRHDRRKRLPTTRVRFILKRR